MLDDNLNMTRRWYAFVSSLGLVVSLSACGVNSESLSDSRTSFLLDANLPDGRSTSIDAQEQASIDAHEHVTIDAQEQASIDARVAPVVDAAIAESNDAAQSPQVDAGGSAQADASISPPPVADANLTDADTTDATPIDARTEPWAAIAPTVGVGAQRNTFAAMAYDVNTDRMVMFGGFGEIGQIGDTSLWDGSSWTTVVPSNSPSPRRAHCMMATDAGVLLFGGSASYQNMNDLWKWDGTTWTPIITDTSPAAFDQPACAIDASRGVLVVYGSSTATGNYVPSTWEFDGSVWTNVVTPHMPSPVEGEVLAYDPSLQEIVMFGGNNGTSEVALYDGTDWTRVASNGPSEVRWYGSTMAWDFNRNTMLIYGGTDFGGPPIPDTLTWDGADITILPTKTTPPARLTQSMAFDFGRQQMVTFGGYGSLGELRGDTWLLDGNDWHLAAPASNPQVNYRSKSAYYDSARKVSVFVDDGGSDIWSWDGGKWSNDFVGSAEVGGYSSTTSFDSDRNRLVLFGGEQAGDNNHQTAEWNGTSWATFTPDVFPPDRSRSAMAYDSIRKVTVLFGGYGNVGDGFGNDTWEWDGTTWTQMAPVTSPPPRGQHTMAFEPVRGKMLMYGGTYSWSGTNFTDTWEWDGTNWTDVSPASGFNPGPRDDTPMVYDADAGLIVLNGGDAVWAWDGATWTDVQATQSVASSNSQLVFDPNQHELIEFGGSADYNVWTFDSTAMQGGSSTPPTNGDGGGGKTRKFGRTATSAVR